MIGLMIRIRRDELHCGNRRRRVFRRLDGTMDIPDHAPPRQHKTGRDGSDLFEDLMGKQRREQPQDSIFADNPFVDGFFEWMGSPDGQQRIEIHDGLSYLTGVIWATIGKTTPKRNSTSLTP